MKMLVVIIVVFGSVSAFPDDFRSLECVKKVLKMEAQKKPGKAIPKNDFYLAAKARAQAEFRRTSEFKAEFQRVYYINSTSKTVIAICDDHTWYEQGNCYEYYFNGKDDQLNLLAIASIPHIGMDKINFVCEGE